jgi:hypothetical protein
MRPSLCLFALALLSACKSEYVVPEGPVQAQTVPHPLAQAKLNNVGFLDPSFKNKIAVERQGARRTESGTLEVWVTIRNRTDHPHQVEGRVQFFDADQAPTEGPSAWKRVHLPPNGTQTWKEFSTQVDGIEYYYVEMREGR